MKVLNVNHLLDPETGGAPPSGLSSSAASCKERASRPACWRSTSASARRGGMSWQGVKVVALPCLNRRYFVPWASPGLIDTLVADADVVHLSGTGPCSTRWCTNPAAGRASLCVLPAGALTTFGRSLRLKRAYDARVGPRAGLVRGSLRGHHRPGTRGLRGLRGGARARDGDPQWHRPRAVHAVTWTAERRIRERFQTGAAPYVLFLGRLNAIKGPDLLLEAFAKVADRFPEFHLVFAGPDGGLLASLVESAAQSPLKDRIHFPGYLAGADKTAALSAATLLAIPSRREAMSIVVLEAGISGTPTLFTDACGLEGIAALGAGTMVEASAEALAGGLSALLADTPSLARGGRSPAGPGARTIPVEHAGGALLGPV